MSFWPNSTPKINLSPPMVGVSVTLNTSLRVRACNHKARTSGYPPHHRIESGSDTILEFEFLT